MYAFYGSPSLDYFMAIHQKKNRNKAFFFLIFFIFLANPTHAMSLSQKKKPSLLSHIAHTGIENASLCMKGHIFADRIDHALPLFYNHIKSMPIVENLLSKKGIFYLRHVLIRDANSPLYWHALNGQFRLRE